MATTVLSAKSRPKKKFSAYGLFLCSTNSTESCTYLVEVNGWYMFKNVANDLLAPAAMRLTRGSPVYISPIRSKEGFIRSISITWRDVIDINCKCSISSYFFTKETDSCLHLDSPI